MSTYGSYAQHGMGASDGIGSRILWTITRNPEGILLMLAGAALLMRTGRGTSEQEQGGYIRRSVASAYDPYQSTFEEREYAGVGGYEGPRAQAEGVADQARSYASAARERVAEYGEAAKARTSQMGDQVASAAEAAGEYVSEATERVAGAARSTADTARRRITRAQSTIQENFESMMREQPLAIAAVGFVAGAAVAALLPTTEAEEQALGPAREAAYRAGENLREAASEAGETLRARAAERGLDAEGLKDLAGEVAGSFTSAVAGKEKEQQGSPSVVPENAEPITGENR